MRGKRKREHTPETISVSEFEQIYKDYYPRLYHYAYDFIEDTDASEDIVSEVFFHLWHERGSLKPDTLSSYLYVTVRNRCLNYLRHQKGKSAYEAYCRAAFSEEDDNYWQIMEERISEMRREIDKMPQKTCFVLEQCYLNGHTYREVGEMMGITDNGVKKHIVKAFAILREHFKVKKN